MPAPASKPPLSAATGEFGRRVRQRRLELEMSQEELAESSDLHWSYLGQIERGQNNLTLHNILRVAQALDVDPGELVTDLPKMPLELRPRRVRTQASRKDKTPAKPAPGSASKGTSKSGSRRTNSGTPRSR